MPLQISIRPIKDGDSIYAIEDRIFVYKGLSVYYSDDNFEHKVAAAVPDRSTFFPKNVILQAGGVLFNINQTAQCAFIFGMEKKVGDTFLEAGMIFSVEQTSQAKS